MPAYPYQCCKCDHQFISVKRVMDLDDPAPCPKCESTATERHIGTVAINKVWQEQYNPAFGKVIKSRAHLKEELTIAKGEGREMIEVGSEPVEKIHKAFDRERQEKTKARWNEPVEKAMQEVLG